MQRHRVTSLLFVGLAAMFLLSLTTDVIAGEESGEEDTSRDPRDALVLSDESRLTQFMLKRYRRAGKVSRPLLNSSDAIEVEFSLSLIQILDFDETNQVLTTNVWKRYRWNDQLLTWNASEFGGINDVRLPSDKVWTPDIVLYNTATEQDKSHRELITVNASGTITWIPPTIFRSSCQMNMRNFPFDEQNCTLKFGSWTYDGNKLSLAFYDHRPAIDLTEFIDSSEWDILSTSAIHNTRYYPCCADEPYPDLTFYIAVRRRTAFYVYVLILPSVLLSFLTLVLFWIPPQRPDRTSFGMSLFSSFFVLLLILVQSSPPSSSSISLLGLYYCINMVMIAFSTMVSAIVINITHNIKTRPVPRFLRLVVLDVLAKVFCANQRPCKQQQQQQQQYSQPPNTVATIVSAIGKESQTLITTTTTTATNGSTNKVAVTSDSEVQPLMGSAPSTRTEWKIVAVVVDRLFFLLYFIGICLSLVFVFPR